MGCALKSIKLATKKDADSLVVSIPVNTYEVNGDHSQNWNAPLFRGFRGENDKGSCECASKKPIPLTVMFVASISMFACSIQGFLVLQSVQSPLIKRGLLEDPSFISMISRVPMNLHGYCGVFPNLCHVFYDTGTNNPLTNQKSDFKKHAKEIESRKNMVKSLSEPFKIPQSHLILLVG